MLMHKAAAAECLRWQAALDGLWRGTSALVASASTETAATSVQEAATWAVDTGEVGCGHCQLDPAANSSRAAGPGTLRSSR